MSKSVPQLTEKTDTEDNDLLHIVRSNVDYKQKRSNFITNIKSRYGNTIFVNSVSGDDVTGEVENPARPFQTITAASTASAAYYTGGIAPSSTNIITMDIRGTFTEAISLINFHNYNLNDSYLTTAIFDVVGGVNCTIYGNAYITATGGTTIMSVAGPSVIYIKCKTMVGSFYMTNALATIDVDCNIVSQTNNSITLITDGTITFRNASMTNSGASMFFMVGAGSVRVVECNCISNNEILKTSTVSSTAVATFRRSKLETSGTNFDTINLLTNTGTNLTLILNGCTLIANGTGNSIDAAQATNVYIYASCNTNLTHDTGNVTLLLGTVANGRYLIAAATI